MDSSSYEWLAGVFAVLLLFTAWRERRSGSRRDTRLLAGGGVCSALAAVILWGT
ncbi:MAG: hypothetical protein J0H69_14595 [Burkholderiales bacterium]|nr:hypothetical protein [Burkholderiales bacterium]